MLVIRYPASWASARKVPGQGMPFSVAANRCYIRYRCYYVAVFCTCNQVRPDHHVFLPTLTCLAMLCGISAVFAPGLRLCTSPRFARGSTQCSARSSVKHSSGTALSDVASAETAPSSLTVAVHAARCTSQVFTF